MRADKFGTFEDFTALLPDKGIKTSTGSKHYCPAHEGNSPALSVSCKDNKILLHCFAGCPTENILNALGLTAADLFLDSGADQMPDKSKPERRIVTTYDYLDKNGKLLFQVVRYDPKGFTQRKPNGQGGWIWKGIPEAEKVLFNLPAVTDAIQRHETIFIVEGEKDCLTLKGFGLTATCNSGGAGKWLPQYSETLKGADVVVIPDADMPGKEHALKVSNSLHGIAASIKTLNLPSHKDVTEWINAGHTKEELLELVVAAGSDNTPFDEDNFKVKEWPVFNPKALYGLAGRAVELAIRYSEADPAAVLFQFLAFFGAKCGAGVKFFVGDTVHYPRLNVAIIGNSSKARKGTSAAPVKKFFRSDIDAVRVSPGPLSSGEGIIDAVRDETREYQLDKKTGVHDWVITDPGVTDKRLIILDEELASALASMKRDGNKLSTIIRNMWDSGTCAPLTKTAKTKCTDAHVIICTHSTFQELKAKLEDNEHVNGFGNRFLWVMARRQKLVSRPLPMPEDELGAIKEQIEKAFQYSQEMERLYFSDDTWKRWDAVYPELTKDHPGFVGAIVNRGEAQVVRLSMIYALMDCSDKIRPVHLEAALSAWDYCRESALYIFGDREEDSLTQRIVDILEDGPRTATEIYNSLNRHIKSKHIKSSLDDLIARGRVQAEQEKTEGRTKTIFSISVCAKSAKSVLSSDTLTLNALNTLNAPMHKEKINLNLYPNQSSEVDYVEL